MKAESRFSVRCAEEEGSILIPRRVNNCIPQADASDTQLHLIVNRHAHSLASVNHLLLAPPFFFFKQRVRIRKYHLT